MRGVLARTARRLSYRPVRAAFVRSSALAVLQGVSLVLLALGAAPQGPEDETVAVRSAMNLAHAAAVLSDFGYETAGGRTPDGLHELLVEPLEGFGVEAAATDIAELLADMPVVIGPRVYFDPLWISQDSGASRLGGLTALAAAGLLLLGAVRRVAAGADAERRRLQVLGLSTGELRTLFFLQAGWIAAPATAACLLVAVAGNAAVPGMMRAWLVSVLVLGGLASVSAMIYARRELGGGLYRKDQPV